MILACELEKNDREEEKITSNRIGGVFERLRLRISGDGEAQTGGVK